MKFSAPVTFFVRKNGSGKSTLLEAIVINRMTDDQALRMHQRLSGTQPGSLADMLA